MMKKFLAIGLLVFSATAFAGNSIEAEIVSMAETEIAKNKLDTKQTLGTLGGAGVGYALGRIISNNGGIIGAGVGALIGNSATDSVEGLAITVRYGNELRTVVQPVHLYPDANFQVGDKVILSNMNGRWVVTK